MLGTARSRNISFQIIVQTVEQIKKIYGKESKDMISNMSNILVLGTHNDFTAKYLSELAGKTAAQTISAKGAENTASYNITPEEIMHLPADKAIVVIRGYEPIIDPKYITEDDPGPKNIMVSGCTDDKCKEPTKKINGMARPFCLLDALKGEVPKRRYIYTCKYLKNNEPCPFLHKDK